MKTVRTALQFIGKSVKMASDFPAKPDENSPLSNRPVGTGPFDHPE